MCGNCDDIILRESFYSPKDYLDCLAYIQELLNTGKFVLVENTCDLDKVKDVNGCWIYDLINHEIKCKKCGKQFTCFMDTYHGIGSFRNVK